MTKYLVFTNDGTKNDADGERWAFSGEADARSSDAAIRDVLKGIETDGEYVAVPARSWQPVKVKVEQALKFS